MKFHQVLAATLCTGSLLTLQGCGGGDSTSTTKPGTKTPPPGAGTTTPPPGAGTTTAAGTTTTPPRDNDNDSPPLTGDEAVKHLNDNYRGWKDGDEQSPAGVVMRMANVWDDKGGLGFFCPGFLAYSGCFEGHAKCITSAAILNDHVMLDQGKVATFAGQGSGIIFNTSMVETKLGRCTYQFDGGTFGRYNRGCGGIAQIGKGKCTDKSDATGAKGAWFDIDPATGKETTDTSNVVLNDYCPNRITAKTAPTQMQDPACYWKGPAWSKTGKAGKSETHKMMSQRVKNQGEHGDPVKTWNEVVIDDELLLQEIIRDPAKVVLAMVYVDGGMDSAIQKKKAEKMAKDMQAEFNMRQPVPVVGVDSQLNVVAQPDVPGPFFNVKHWSTQTTTTTPRSGPACCSDGCDGQDCTVPPAYCGQSKANCEGDCSGEWCTSQSAFLM